MQMCRYCMDKEKAIMVVVLIPSYKPDEGLITLLEQLTA